jgi:hypothetical protein
MGSRPRDSARFRRVDPRRAERGRQAEEQRRGNRHAGGETQDAKIEMRVQQSAGSALAIEFCTGDRESG